MIGITEVCRRTTNGASHIQTAFSDASSCRTSLSPIVHVQNRRCPTSGDLGFVTRTMLCDSLVACRYHALISTPKTLVSGRGSNPSSGPKESLRHPPQTSLNRRRWQGTGQYYSAFLSSGEDHGCYWEDRPTACAVQKFHCAIYPGTCIPV